MSNSESDLEHRLVSISYIILTLNRITSQVILLLPNEELIATYSQGRNQVLTRHTSDLNSCSLQLCTLTIFWRLGDSKGPVQPLTKALSHHLMLTPFEQQQSNSTPSNYCWVLMHRYPDCCPNLSHSFDNAVLVSLYQVWMCLSPSSHHASRPQALLQLVECGFRRV